jgi:hypothetical protein
MFRAEVGFAFCNTSQSDMFSKRLISKRLVARADCACHRVNSGSSSVESIGANPTPVAAFGEDFEHYCANRGGDPTNEY